MIFGSDMTTTSTPSPSVLVPAAVSITLILMLMVGLGPTVASADSHGYCDSYDYNDDGEKYCDDFQSIEEVRQRHIRLRKYCKDLQDASGDNCAVTSYIRDGERHFYNRVRACLYDDDENRSEFYDVSDYDISDDSFWYFQQIGYHGTCFSVENKKHFNSFPYIGIDYPIYYVIRNGILEYGGKMP